MRDFISGQRWISDSELAMGLGTVLSTDQRSVTIVFLATGDTRTYAKATAPLTRVSFAPGDRVRSHEGWSLLVESVNEHQGLLTYHGTHENGGAVTLEEAQLDTTIQLNRPIDRLFTRQIDQNKWFELRHHTLLYANQLSHTDVRGLMGGRTSLIPHQLYIAHEVATRYAPRVLLADEVGLGKTIEAGLILHHQLLTERVKRVLIIVPESLVHQWLVEMLRRFNLCFSLFDEERCSAVEEGDDGENPFDSEQLVICSLDFLVSHSRRFQQALSAAWDLLVVDEAHHLQWSLEQVSPEYALVEKLAVQTKGVLLLTATPEQLGKASHFARLRLLDPDRFPAFEAFEEEEKHYQPIARAVESLLGDQPLDNEAYQTLLSTVSEGDNQQLLDVLQSAETDSAAKVRASEELIEHLLDRHGTGRVLFRNTRAAVKGFPDRRVTPYPLPEPDLYRECVREFQAIGHRSPQDLLCPELLFRRKEESNESSWTLIDPRIDWLGRKLKELKPGKVLVIAATSETALDISVALRAKAGIHAAVFHEALSLVERDRAAAFFADKEYGSQVLVCSEIGSEGRNFQFAHHLILFDLPLNPDVLEQRIGRLDRIGQTETIQIHVPYMKGTAQEVMYRWYQEGLSAFEHTCPAGHMVFDEVKASLADVLWKSGGGDEASVSELMASTTRLHSEIDEMLHRGRDVLLEYNSHRPQLADVIKQRISAQDIRPELRQYMDYIFDCFGIDIEEDSEHSFILRPSNHMQMSSFPALPEDGSTITFDRNTALANEDMQFITWEHPMVTGAMELVMSSELGNTALIALRHEGINPGTLLLESLYVLESASSDEIQSSRYLPPTVIRTILDQNGNSYDAALSQDVITRDGVVVAVETAYKIVRAREKVLRELVSLSETSAQQEVAEALNIAHQQAHDGLTKETNRLKALQQVNPNVRSEEIHFLETQLEALDRVIDAATLRQDALRVIVAV